MSALNIFVSFEYDRDNDLKNNFFRQAETETTHRVENCSLNESHKTNKWKSKARKAIRGCDVVVVLIGPNTHNAPGVRVETDMARSFKKPVIQVIPQDRPYKNGLPYLKRNEPIPWDWEIINQELERVSPRR